jgi:hypothetical protein
MGKVHFFRAVRGHLGKGSWGVFRGEAEVGPLRGRSHGLAGSQVLR